jgi:Fe-S-cluster containining protein
MSNDLNNILDCRNKKLNINGNCMEMLPVCQAMCCSMFNVDLTPEEYESGLYDAQPFCLFTYEKCDNEKVSCINRKYRLKRRKDGYCVYLDDKSRLCSIHDKRPSACRDFDCKGGWTINFDFFAADKKLSMRLEKLKGDMVFMPHPLMSFKNVFYSKPQKTVTFVKKPVNKCGTVSTTDVLDIPDVDCALLTDIIARFDGEKDLDAVLKEVNAGREVKLSKEDFHSIAWILNNHYVIVFKHIAGGDVTK